MDYPTTTIAGVCSGVGMLELGASLGLEQLGFRTQPVFVCEWESATANVLRQRMEDEAMEPCPVWCGDLGDFDGRPFRRLVDVLCAGLPYQPFSVAGKQAGNDDPRAWGTGQGPQPNFLRLVAEIEPAVVFLENVPVWVTGGHFRRFGSELSGLGYTIEEPLFIRAADVGASHRRERVFVMAHRDGGLTTQQDHEVRTGRNAAGDGCGDLANAQNGNRRGEQQPRTTESRRAGSARGGGQLDDTAGPLCDRSGERIIEGETTEGRPRLQGSDQRRCAVGHTTGQHAQGRRGEHANQRIPGPTGGTIFAPGPGSEQWPEIIANYPDLAPSVEPGFRVLVDGVAYVVDASRADQLRQTGNGVVPLQAALSFVELFKRIGTE